MREYKFRAWDTKEKKMYYDMNIGTKSMDVIKICSYPDYEFMQYIGFPDKNGKEIYEGDICESKIHNPSRTLIEFIEGGYCATHSDLVGYPIDINHFYDSTGCMIEVIGNIYEHPELIKSL
jgi:uncharacterized phage protein (TIGR01671 family)